MINKKNIWALTLFSLILVLSIYYITMPSEFLSNSLNASILKEDKTKSSVLETNEIIEALKIENEEEKNKKIKELQTILTNEKATKEEKNNAYEELKKINLQKGKETSLENKIKEKYKVDNFVKINEDKVNVVIIKKEIDEVLAAGIMKLIEENFDEKVYVSVKFQK